MLDDQTDNFHVPLHMLLVSQSSQSLLIFFFLPTFCLSALYIFQAWNSFVFQAGKGTNIQVHSFLNFL